MMPWWKELQKGELRSIEEAARSGGVKVEDDGGIRTGGGRVLFGQRQKEAVRGI